MSTTSPVELLQNLIRFNTTNPPGNEAECITYINNLLAEAGFETTLIALVPERPNLVTRLKGQGNAKPLLLYGHVDVQPTEGQKWRHPPFEAKIVDGYIWGRGALDMKGEVAMMLTALLRAKREGHKGRESDMIPEALFTTPLKGNEMNPHAQAPGRDGEITSRVGMVVDRTEFERMKSEYYQLRGWDVASGLQTVKRLKEIDLTEVAQELGRMGLAL